MAALAQRDTRHWLDAHGPGIVLEQVDDRTFAALLEVVARSGSQDLAGLFRAQKSRALATIDRELANQGTSGKTRKSFVWMREEVLQ